MKIKSVVTLLMFIVISLSFTACQSDSSQSGQQVSSQPASSSNSADVEATFPSFLLMNQEETPFGMSEGDLINKKGEGVRSENGNMRIYSNVDGYFVSEHAHSPIMFDYSVGYDFGDDNSLQTVIFLLPLDQLSGDFVGYCIDDIMSMLCAEYGEPTGEAEKWFDDKYKDDSGMLGYAIENGDYAKIALWEVADAQVAFYIGGSYGSYVAYTTNEEEIENLQVSLTILQA